MQRIEPNVLLVWMFFVSLGFFGGGVSVLEKLCVRLSHPQVCINYNLWTYENPKMENELVILLVSAMRCKKIENQLLVSAKKKIHFVHPCCKIYSEIYCTKSVCSLPRKDIFFVFQASIRWHKGFLNKTVSCLSSYSTAASTWSKYRWLHTCSCNHSYS